MSEQQPTNEAAGGGSALTAELGAEFDREEERYLREALAMLDESCRKMAKPYIDRLVFLQSLRPSPRMLVTKEQAEALGLTVHNAEVEPGLTK